MTKQENFYQIDTYTIGSKKYPWASGYGPAKDLSFLDCIPAIKERKMAVWELSNSSPGISIEPGGTQWPDILGCGAGFPFFFVGDRIIHTLTEEEIYFFRATEMPIATIKAKRLQSIPPPKYFVLEAHPGIDVDWTAMGIPTDNNNRAITNPYPTPWPPKQWIVARSSWNGSDLMSYRNWQTPMTLICTEKIKKLAEEKNWTNIKFTLIESS